VLRRPGQWFYGLRISRGSSSLCAIPGGRSREEGTSAGRSITDETTSGWRPMTVELSSRRHRLLVGRASTGVLPGVGPWLSIRPLCAIESMQDARRESSRRDAVSSSSWMARPPRASFAQARNARSFRAGSMLPSGSRGSVRGAGRDEKAPVEADLPVGGTDITLRRKDTRAIVVEGLAYRWMVAPTPHAQLGGDGGREYRT